MMSSTVMTPSPNAPSSCSTSSAKPSESMPRSISEADVLRGPDVPRISAQILLTVTTVGEAARAAGDLADSGAGAPPWSPAGGGGAVTAGACRGGCRSPEARAGAGASPPTPRTTMWALLPAKPNELTPTSEPGARVSPPGPGMRSREPSIAFCTAGLTPGLSTAKGGIWPCSSIRTALSMPTAPAADSRWPKCIFAAVSVHGAPGPAVTAASAEISTGSPSLVPVPCISTAARSRGSTPASSHAARITRSCASGSTAVMGLRRLFWLTALPMTVARGMSAGAGAEVERSRKTTPPSART